MLVYRAVPPLLSPNQGRNHRQRMCQPDNGLEHLARMQRVAVQGNASAEAGTRVIAIPCHVNVRFSQSSSL
jgi:hypothetical protein